MSERYRVSNCFGQNTISAERALQIWHSWPAELRKAKNDDPKVGFQVWAYYEATERVLMRTRIEPIDEDDLGRRIPTVYQPINDTTEKETYL
jgi:hypothetical protein